MTLILALTNENSQIKYNKQLLQGSWQVQLHVNELLVL